MSYYVYMLECSDGTLYTGYTDDLEKRLAAHNAGEGAKYTRSRRPCKLVYTEAFAKKNEAMSREWHIKHTLTRREKLALIGGSKVD
ncbi:MAG: GIY-YIG nuclease family protein [Acidaminococcaceae bacterium]|nr:GIY-YIG nuclease family protein [Acidaminococcaceae bacterium]